MNTTRVEKPNKKVVSPPTKKELQELEHDYIVECTEVSESGVTFQRFYTVSRYPCFRLYIKPHHR